MKFSVSRDATCAPSLRSMFSPSVQSAQRAWSIAIWSARDDPLAVSSENDSGDAASGDVGIVAMSTLGSCWPWYGTHVPVATNEQLEEAIATAERAFPAWSARTWDQREEALIAFGALLEQHKDQLTELIMREGGKDRMST